MTCSNFVQSSFFFKKKAGNADDIFPTGMHTPFPNGSYTGNEILPLLLCSWFFLYFTTTTSTTTTTDSCYILSGYNTHPRFITGVNDHLYTIYDPRDDSEETWDYWRVICKVVKDYINFVMSMHPLYAKFRLIYCLLTFFIIYSTCSIYISPVLKSTNLE